MFENTYVGKFWRKPKMYIRPTPCGSGGGGLEKTRKLLFFELSENFTAKRYVKFFFDFGFGFSTIQLGKEN